MHIEVTDNTVTLSGERRLEHEGSTENCRRIECEYGSFDRSFTLPRTVDKDDIAAEMRDGVLRLTLPKIAAEEKREIPVRAVEAETEKEGAKKPAEQPAAAAAT